MNPVVFIEVRCDIYDGVRHFFVMRKLTKEEFIERSKIKHSDKYDYSLVEYINNNTKVKIIFPIHGEFKQSPNRHMMGQGCNECGGKMKSNTSKFIEKAKTVHGNKYDYSLVEYINGTILVKIICPIHGIFEQYPNNHLANHGCKLCGIGVVANKKIKGKDFFVEKASKKHNNFYNYDKVIYTKSINNVTITCPIHGDFEQNARLHMKRAGYPSCSGNKKGNLNDFINKANIIHQNKYNYSKSEYKNARKRLLINCPLHGDFLQSPYSHLIGNGCPKCKSSKGELTIHKYLNLKNIDFIHQYKLHKYSIIDSRRLMKLDFYIPNFNDKEYVIEYNGEQHYKYVSIFHNKKNSLDKQKNRDKKLRKYCSLNNIILIEIPYWNFDKIDKILDKYFNI